MYMTDVYQKLYTKMQYICVSICTYCQDRFDGVASNSLESIHSQVINALHHGQVKTGLAPETCTVNLH